MTRAGGRPRRVCQYGERVPATLQMAAIVGSLPPGLVLSRRPLRPPLPVREIHQVGSRAITRIDGRVAADQQ